MVKGVPRENSCVSAFLFRPIEKEEVCTVEYGGGHTLANDKKIQKEKKKRKDLLSFLKRYCMMPTQ